MIPSFPTQRCGKDPSYLHDVSRDKKWFVLPRLVYTVRVANYNAVLDFVCFFCMNIAFSIWKLYPQTTCMLLCLPFPACSVFLRLLYNYTAYMTAAILMQTLMQNSNWITVAIISTAQLAAALCTFEAEQAMWIEDLAVKWAGEQSGHVPNLYIATSCNGLGQGC